jgi:hypothetical protein
MSSVTGLIPADTLNFLGSYLGCYPTASEIGKGRLKTGQPFVPRDFGNLRRSKLSWRKHAVDLKIPAGATSASSFAMFRSLVVPRAAVRSAFKQNSYVPVQLSIAWQFRKLTVLPSLPKVVATSAIARLSKRSYATEAS